MTDATLLDPARLAPEPGNPTVDSVMRPEVVFCLPSTPLDAVAKLMADNDLTEIPVLIDRRPVGYIVSRDIVEQYVDGRIEVAGSDLVRQTFVTSHASDVVRTPPLLVDRSQPLDQVATAMRRQGHTTALVMHEDEHPIGMLTLRELAGFAAAHPSGRGRG
ncbi:MAG TPA: CBS domain-containing protein [Candidatus Dormibacteraeota bacterium]|nr:CBS domain-containing protein [Candidatus Dormibacteraeota bacterium]